MGETVRPEELSCYPLIWWWRKWRGDRKNDRCRVLVRGGGRGPKGAKSPKNCLVEFVDGEKVVAPYYALRRPRS